MRKEGYCSNQDNMGCWHAASSQQELLQPPLPLPRFCLVMQSSRRVHKNTIVINISCGLYQKSVIGVKRSVSSISHIGLSFLGAPGAFVSLISFSSLSSASANPSRRVQDRDRRELSGCSCSCICCLWRGVTCVAGITVVDTEDSEGWGLHSGVLLLLVALVLLLK